MIKNYGMKILFTCNGFLDFLTLSGLTTLTGQGDLSGCEAADSVERLSPTTSGLI